MLLVIGVVEKMIRLENYSSALMHFKARVRHNGRYRFGTRCAPLVCELRVTAVRVRSRRAACEPMVYRSTWGINMNRH